MDITESNTEKYTIYDTGLGYRIFKSPSTELFYSLEQNLKGEYDLEEFFYSYIKDWKKVVPTGEFSEMHRMPLKL